jgi:hypothetical protein
LDNLTSRLSVISVAIRTFGIVNSTTVVGDHVAQEDQPPAEMIRDVAAEKRGPPRSPDRARRKCASSTGAALAGAKQKWTQMGVTKSELGPITDAYNNAEQINQDLQNPVWPRN